MSIALTLSYVTSMQQFTYIIASFLKEYNICFKYHQITDFLSGKSKLSKLLELTASETLSMMRKSVNNQIYFSYNGSNKKGTHYMIKEISF